MKLRYFGYYLRKFETQDKFLFNIKSIIDAFVSSKDMALKGSFKRGDDKLYITPVTGHQNLYYFVRTSDNELIKRINEQNLKVGELTDRLSENEKVAYASYVYLSDDDCILACAGSTSCSRFDDFAGYINELFKKVGLEKYELTIEALTSNSEKKDLLQMEMVNSVYIDVAADRGLGKLIAQELTGSTESSIGNFRITIEPSGTNLKQMFAKMLNRLVPGKKAKNEQGVTRIGAKAKHDELKGQLTDYWLDNENNLTDSLNPKATKVLLPDQIAAKFDSNLQIDGLYKLYIANNGLKKQADSLLQKYTNSMQFTVKSKGVDNVHQLNTGSD